MMNKIPNETETAMSSEIFSMTSIECFVQRYDHVTHMLVSLVCACESKYRRGECVCERAREKK